MAKSQIQTTCPENLESDVIEYKRENGLEHTSDAARQLLQMGVNHWQSETAAETLVRQATTISAVVGIASAIMVSMASWALPAAMAFTATTIIFASIWAAIRILSERGLR